MTTPTPISLIQSLLETVSTVRLQLLNLQVVLSAPQAPSTPPSPDNTLLVLGGHGPSSIVDTAGNTWTLQPTGPSSIPTVHLNGYPDSLTGPATLVLFLSSTIYFQRITGQWYQWSANHWLPSIDPRVPATPEWGPPALRAVEALDWAWLPSNRAGGLDMGPVNLDLLLDLFTDTSPHATSFLPSPIPIATRPKGILPPVYQRSDNTFLLPIFGPLSPATFQFPGLRPTYIRLWSALRASPNSPHDPPTPLRVATGTDTIAVPCSRNSLHIIELSLG